MGIDFSKINNRINKERTEISREDVVYNNENVSSVNENLATSREEVITNAITKLNEIEKDLNGSFIEREAEIEMLLLGLLSATNCFLHGPAGTGKSQLTEELSKRITNSNYFRILMGKTTEPAEVFGPVSINSLKNDKYKVITDNKLPKAEIAFLDEVFKANSAVLNSLLTIMNEKLFFNDTTEEVPTISVIGASNEYPEEDNLTALYDRFLLRWPVSYIQNPTARVDLFEKFLESRRTDKKVAAAISSSISIGELRLLIEEAKDIKIPKKILITYNTLLTKIQNSVGVVISDRRKNEALKVIQALALKRGLKTATTAEFEALKYIFWQKEDHIQDIIDILNPFINPYQVAYDEYTKLAKECRTKLNNEMNKQGVDTDSTVEQAISMAQIKTTVSKAITKLDKLLVGMKLEEPMRPKFEAIEKELNNLLIDIKDVMSDFSV